MTANELHELLDSGPLTLVARKEGPAALEAIAEQLSEYKERQPRSSSPRSIHRKRRCEVALDRTLPLGGPPVDPRDAVEALRVLEAARQASRNREVVTLQPRR